MSTALKQTQPTTSAVSLGGINKSYKHFRLSDIDLEIEPGTVNGLILFLQTLLISIELPVLAKLILVTLVTWLFCIATYVVFVRYTPIGWMLHGKRQFP